MAILSGLVGLIAILIADIGLQFRTFDFYIDIRGMK